MNLAKSSDFQYTIEAKRSYMHNYHEPSKLLTPATIQSLTEKLNSAWSNETCHPTSKELWTMENKALGQCSVTALVINDLFGGQIANNDQYNHLWNILPDGTQHDFTRSQFEGQDEEFKIDSVTTKGAQLNHPKSGLSKTRERYELLRKQF